MTARARYAQAMEWLYIACVSISGIALVVITLIIPLGVFFRYVLSSPLSWPEPASVVMMVTFSFLGGAAVYRANVHIAVEALLNAVPPRAKRAMLWAVDACMMTTALFMLFYGAHLCWIVQHQTMAEFPGLRVAFVYLPIPLAGLLTALFIIERLWAGPPPRTSVMYNDAPVETE